MKTYENMTAKELHDLHPASRNRRGCGSQGGKVTARLELVPCAFDEACAFVSQHHRHHRPPQGLKFCIAVASGDRVCGVAIVGRPVARMRDDGLTLEVTRVATDGTPNACSFLYGACRRAAFALGFKRLITYTLPSESGSSLRGAGFKLLGEAGGGSWSRKSRPRVDKAPLQTKLAWEAAANEDSK